jgi:hypothetical protein
MQFRNNFLGITQTGRILNQVTLECPLFPFNLADDFVPFDMESTYWCGLRSIKREREEDISKVAAPYSDEPFKF